MLGTAPVAPLVGVAQRNSAPAPVESHSRTRLQTPCCAHSTWAASKGEGSVGEQGSPPHPGWEPCSRAEVHCRAEHVHVGLSKWVDHVSSPPLHKMADEALDVVQRQVSILRQALTPRVTGGLRGQHRCVAIQAGGGAYAFTGETREMSLANVELVSGGSDRMIWSASSSSSTAWKGDGLRGRDMLHWRQERLGGGRAYLWSVGGASAAWNQVMQDQSLTTWLMWVAPSWTL